MRQSKFAVKLAEKINSNLLYKKNARECLLYGEKFRFPLSLLSS